MLERDLIAKSIVHFDGGDVVALVQPDFSVWTRRFDHIGDTAGFMGSDARSFATLAQALNAYGLVLDVLRDAGGTVETIIEPEGE